MKEVRKSFQKTQLLIKTFHGLCQLVKLFWHTSIRKLNFDNWETFATYEQNEKVLECTNFNYTKS